MFDKVGLILGKGEASFIDSHTVKVGNRTITAQRIFIATRTEPLIHQIDLTVFQI
jgi:pyruvate/2-oxoglutarate dehydrogenase complex dihydrolipoamide dehydrogenase (E3) component